MCNILTSKLISNRIGFSENKQLDCKRQYFSFDKQLPPPAQIRLPEVNPDFIAKPIVWTWHHQSLPHKG